MLHVSSPLMVACQKVLLEVFDINHMTRPTPLASFVSSAVDQGKPLASARGPTADRLARLDLGLVVSGEPPQRRDQSGAVPLKVGVEEVIVSGAVGGGQVVVPVGRVHLPEAIEVELTDEAGEVGGLESVHIVQGEGPRRQDLPFEKLPVDDYGLALAVPEDGAVGRVVHQAPQFGGEVVRIDADR